MPIEETQMLAETIKSLSDFQAVIFLIGIGQIGLVAVVLFMLRNSSRDDSQENEQTRELMKFIGQLHDSSQRVTNAFTEEQKKDWQRNQFFFKHQERQSKIMRHLYFEIGKISKDMQALKNDIGELKNGKK